MERDNGRGLNFSLAARCFSWPPPSSSYTCGYCKREFRSAQALGGHMNVHRRDRARLRQCCPAYAPNPNLIAAHRRAASPLPNLNFLAPPHTTSEPVVYSFFSTTTSATAMKAASVEVNLDLGMGGVCGRGGGAVEEGGLDLELRLGCPWE